MTAAPENSSAVIIRPPRLIPSLVSGFNTVANHIYLILLPVALDLLLWFGPHLRVKTLMQPGAQEILTLMRGSTSADMRPALDNITTLWQQFLEQYNLFSTASTFPVGIPSLMAAQLPIKTPLGTPLMIEITSGGQFVLGWLLLTLTGFLLGSVYFAGIARVTARQIAGDAAQGEVCPDASRVPPFRMGTLGWQTLQVIALVILVLIVLMIIMVPTLVVSLFVALISPFLAQIVLLMVSFGTVWLMVPLIFSPHGIFMCGQSVINAMLNSTRVVRFILPGTGMFLLVAIVINQGLGMLWSTPPESSWMALVGILGHAFIITGLLAASFVYYHGGLAYTQALRKYIMEKV